MTRGVLLGILGGGVPPGCSNPDSISDHQTSKIHTRFQTWILGRNYVIIIRLGPKHKNYSNPFRICIFLFLSYSFGIGFLKKFSQTPVVPSKTQPDSKPKIGQSVYPFSDQNGGGAAHTYMAYIREYPPGQMSGFVACSRSSPVVCLVTQRSSPIEIQIHS